MAREGDCSGAAAGWSCSTSALTSGHPSHARAHGDAARILVPDAGVHGVAGDCAPRHAAQHAIATARLPHGFVHASPYHYPQARSNARARGRVSCDKARLHQAVVRAKHAYQLV